MKFFNYLLIPFLFQCTKISYVAVLDFQSKNVAQNELYYFTEGLKNIIDKDSRFQVIDEKRMARIIEENPGCLESECAVDIGKILKTDFVFAGSLTFEERTYYLNLERIQVNSGETANRYNHQAKSIEELLTRVNLK